jgi:hypothetical protein
MIGSPARAALCFVAAALLSLPQGCGAPPGSAENGSVAPAGKLNSIRATHTATLLKDGQVLITGGLLRAEGDEVTTSAAEVYDPKGGVFRAVASMTAERAGHTATLLQNGDVLITGGIGSGRILDSAEVYRAARGVFEPAGPMSSRRERHAATLLDNGAVLITGGSSGTPLATSDLYDPAANSFRPIGRMNTARFAHTSVRLPDGKVLLAGGADSANGVTRGAEIFNPADRSFTATGHMNEGRHKHAAVLLRDGRVLVAGGSASPEDWEERRATAELYDPSTGNFTPTGSMNVARFKIPAAVALLGDGRVLVCGGDSSVEIFDPARGTFGVASGGLDDALFYPTATALPDARVLIVGGYDDDLRSSKGSWMYVPQAAAVPTPGGGNTPRPVR